ncbi:MAG TPA: LacI family DNA-binding transcriptional regulator [Novosphingobium sp.]|nr:LacI family DNA-binding transcriptional regulator [Novosphingobium sp.]
MTTIRDVARVAGVSIKTVSRVLNKEPKVRAELRARVEQTVAELDYQPNLAARQMGAKRSFVIGMIAPRPVVSYIPQLVVALSWACAEHGYQFVLQAVDHEDRHKAFNASTQFSNRPDAIILAPRFNEDLEMIARFEKAGMRLVRLEGREGLYGTPLNVPDRAAAQAIVSHLIALGHRRIGMLAQPQISQAAEERLQGYKDALALAGIAFDAELVTIAPFNFRAGAEALPIQLARPQRPTAIFAATDAMAVGAQSMAQKLGYRIPDDLAIAGFNDSPLVRAAYPPITSVDFPIDDIAKAAVRAAIGEPAMVETIGRALIVRSSTSGDGVLCRDPYRY